MFPEGGISEDDLEDDLVELKGLKKDLDDKEDELNELKAKMRFFYGKRETAEDDGDTAAKEAAQDRIDSLVGEKTSLEGAVTQKQEDYDKFFSDRNIDGKRNLFMIRIFMLLFPHMLVHSLVLNGHSDTVKREEITGKLDDLNVKEAELEDAEEKLLNAQAVYDAFELAKEKAHDAKSEVGDIKSEIEDDLEDKEDAKDDDDDGSDVVVVVKDIEDIVDAGSTATVDEDIDRAAACVEPVLCSDAVENFMRHFLGNERRLLGSVDYQDYCNEPDIVKAWGAGNNFFEAFLGDDDLYCMIAGAGETLIHTTASRTRYLRGLTGLTADGLGDQLLAKEKACGYSEKEIECMDQWRCNIEDMCAKEILTGKNNCFDIFDYVTACYIWCVGIL
jgi:outer membrane murein-binding lipoprotein Lpp